MGKNGTLGDLIVLSVASGDHLRIPGNVKSLYCIQYTVCCMLYTSADASHKQLTLSARNASQKFKNGKRRGRAQQFVTVQQEEDMSCSA